MRGGYSSGLCYTKATVMVRRFFGVGLGAAVRHPAAGLHAFREFGSGARKAVATSGDILLHIRAEHMDLCFELAALQVKCLGQAVTVVDEVQGFRYFDMRSIIGFVDGTENPAFIGGSYVLGQKCLHDMTGWEALSTEEQERIIGRTKLSDIELDAASKPSCSYSVQTTLEEGGEEVRWMTCYRRA